MIGDQPTEQREIGVKSAPNELNARGKEQIEEFLHPQEYKGRERLNAENKQLIEDIGFLRNKNIALEKNLDCCEKALMSSSNECDTLVKVLGVQADTIEHLQKALKVAGAAFGSSNNNSWKNLMEALVNATAQKATHPTPNVG